MRLFLVLSLIIAFVFPCFSQDRPIRDKIKEGKDKKGKKVEGKKLRTVFVVKGKNDKEYVFLRLTVVQYHKAKAVARVKKTGMIRIVLHPRQVQALRKALGEEAKEARWSKVIIRLSCKRLNKLSDAKGKKVLNRYVIRNKECFLKKDLLNREELVVLGGIAEKAEGVAEEITSTEIKEADAPEDENQEEMVDEPDDEPEETEEAEDGEEKE